MFHITFSRSALLDSTKLNVFSMCVETMFGNANMTCELWLRYEWCPEYSFLGITHISDNILMVYKSSKYSDTITQVKDLVKYIMLD